MSVLPDRYKEDLIEHAEYKLNGLSKIAQRQALSILRQREVLLLTKFLNQLDYDKIKKQRDSYLEALKEIVSIRDNHHDFKSIGKCSEIWKVALAAIAEGEK